MLKEKQLLTENAANRLYKLNTDDRLIKSIKTKANNGIIKVET